MDPPIYFLTVEQVYQLHKLGLEAHGGSDGIRDANALEAAMMQARHVHDYTQEDLFGMAAAYAFHLSQAQAFLDGNKRVAILSAFVFLELNGVPTTFDSMCLYPAMIQFATGELDRKGFAAQLRDLCI